MFKKIKFLPTLIAAIYLFGFLFAFSGDLIIQIQTVRHHNQIKETNCFETISLSLSQWNTLNDKHEIKLDNIYYDVVSHSISGQNVILRAVKDHFESEIRIVFSQIFSKNKIPSSNKKKINNFFSQILFEFTTKLKIIDFFDIVLIKKFKSNFDLKTITFIYLPQKPPCI